MGWIIYSGLFRLLVTQWGWFLHLAWWFFSLWFPLCLYSAFILVEFLVPNCNLISIQMTIFKCLCHLGMKVKLVSVYCSFSKNSVGGAFCLSVHRSCPHFTMYWACLFTITHQQQSRLWKNFCIFTLIWDWKDKMKKAAAWELLIPSK